MERKREPSAKTLSAIDLFAGAGGASQGLIDAGFTVLAAIENDTAAAKTYAANHPLVKLYVADIRSIRADKVLEDIDLKRGNLTILKACPPCQTFSTLGKTDPDDERNDLVGELWRFISKLQPKTFVLENVPGLRHDKRLSALIRSARAIGYGVRDYIVDASSFGVPQRRRRLIVLGVRGLSRLELPDSLLDALPSCFDRSDKTAGDALAPAAGLDSSDPIHRFRQLQSATLNRIRHIPVGGNRFDLPRRYQLKCHIKLKSRECGASYGRVRVDRVAPTMTSRCTTPACGSFIHPTEHRGITLREAALIQTFPPSYKFEGGYGQIERQIGNAVPVRLAYALGLIVTKLTV